MNNLLFLGERYVVRLKPALSAAGLIAGIILAHQDLLAWNLKSVIVLVCLIILALNNSVGGKYQNRGRTMSWSIFGKVLVRSLPHIIEFVENSQATGSKKAAAVNLAHQELKDFSPELSKHPKVLEAVAKASDALVELHNQVALAQDELGNK
jgi:hypothetical protein